MEEQENNSSLDQWPISLIDYYPFSLFEDDDQDDEIQTQQNLSQSSSETYMVGFNIVNIVGLQYYSGRISGREMVGLVREPLNQYDSNAIKVLNTRTVQVGYIERSAASVLAPLIDSNLIMVEGIVPNTGIGARGNRFTIPCQVHIFCKVEDFGTVKTAISRGGLNLISNNDVSFTLSESMIVKEQMNKGKEEGKSVDEIFKLVDEKLSKKGVLNAIEPPKDVIKSELFLHQKEGLSWLVHRENSCELPPFWEERDGIFANELTNYQTDKRPEPIRGGIFADDMGLGKTLTLLSLIAIDKCGTSVNFEDIEDETEPLVVPGSRKSKRGRVSKHSSRKKQKTIEDVVLDNRTVKGKWGVSKTTLVVCPPSVFSTWITQLTEHTIKGRLKMYMYYGERTQDALELQKYDIVLTTYSTLASEETCLKSPIKKIEWWRVILDEAHIIKNPSAKQSHAVTNLNANRRWVVTGTPIQNGSMDLFSLMAFLRFEPFSVKSYWNSLVQRPLAQGSEKGLSRLQALMGTISLRRTKESGSIGLPPKTIETCIVDLSAEERKLYDEMESYAKSFVQNYISAGSVIGNYSTVLGIILRLRQICTNMALCPSDIRASLPSNNFEDVSNNPELLKKLISLLQDGEDLDCPICISPPTDILITCCAHAFCRSCILKALKCAKPSCPLCRHPLSESDLFSSPPESAETEGTATTAGCTASSKVEVLLKLLSASREENPAVKSVIFSQFRKLLLLLEEPLKAAGFKTLRLDGSMNAKRRAEVIREFGVAGCDGPTILLASLKASGTGINLTAASRVYLLEPWWNPAVEEQAMDRVHRIGQKEDVKVVRIIARNSIDERILELQEKKKKLAREAFCRRDKDRREVSIDDLRTLMSL